MGSERERERERVRERERERDRQRDGSPVYSTKSRHKNRTRGCGKRFECV